MTHNEKHRFYDGSFNGFLTILFDVAYNGLEVDSVSRKEKNQDGLFPQPDHVDTRPKDALHLWELMRARNYGALKTLYFAFMSGQEHIENRLLSFFRDWFARETGASDISYDLKYRELYRLAGQVEKEKNTLERKLLLQNGAEGPCIRMVRPKYNVLPLISKYLRTRFREKEWSVFDLGRKYGIHHEHGNISFIPLRKEHLRPLQVSGAEEPSRSEGSYVGVFA